MTEYQKLRQRETGRQPSAAARRDRAQDGAESAMQRLLNQRTAVQRQVELGDALARRTAARPVVQRMTLDEYNQEMETNEGSTVAELLDEGYAAYLEQAGEELEAAWKEARTNEAAAYLATVDLDKFRSDARTSQAVQIVVGGLGKGKPLLLPPDPASLADTDLLFRGTTLDTSTNELYVGSGGSEHGSPTTPSATIAALFATKSATEFGVPGRIVFGPMGNVRGRGFAPPDTMAGQEQEITVAAPPQETNALLGGVLPVEDFRRALKLIGVTVPNQLTPGQAFDARLESAARKPLTTEQQERLKTFLTGNPQENIARWEGLQASASEIEASLTHEEVRLSGLSDTEAAREIATGIRARLTAARGAATLEEGGVALEAAVSDLARLREVIAGLSPTQSAQSSTPEEDEDFDLFGD